MKNLEIKNIQNSTIFKEINPYDNLLINTLSQKDLLDIFKLISNYLLEYRKRIEIDSEITFGTEIEFENISNPRRVSTEFIELFSDNNYSITNDGTLKSGREIVSPILTDTNEDWRIFHKVCLYAQTKGNIGENAGGHIHIGATIFEDNIQYMENLVLLWLAYENVITRFSNGEFNCDRPTQYRYAGSLRRNIFEEEHKREVTIKDIDDLDDIFGTRYIALNFTNYIDEDKDKYTIEVRCPNGTLNPIVWQNNINFFIKLFLYAKSNKFNKEAILEKIKKTKNIKENIYYYIDINSALELCDLIFDNNLDKVYFLRQYLKDFKSDKNYQLSKKFTM